MSPGCGQISTDSTNTKKSIIVAGGFTAAPGAKEEHSKLFATNAVEILHANAKLWVRGPDLPIPIGSSAAVQDLEGGFILVGGSTDWETPLDIILRLANAGGDVTWRKLPQKLKKPRMDHVAVLVPNVITSCIINGNVIFFTYLKRTSNSWNMFAGYLLLDAVTAFYSSDMQVYIAV